MTYLYAVTERIEINPPLAWSTIRDSKFLPARAADEALTVCYEITEDTEDGEDTRQQAVAIVPPWEDEYNARDLKEELAELAREVHEAGSTMCGYLVCAGEDQGDIARYSVGDNAVVRVEQARLSWPDDTAVQL